MTTNDTWTVKQALDWTCGYLERKGDGNPRLSAEWLIAEACGLSRVELYMGLERPLSSEERCVLRDYVQRRGAGEPLQYIAGEAPFRYITVRVRPGVLIPRPETEVLVSEALSCLPPARKREAAWSAEAAEQEAAAVSAVKEALARFERENASLFTCEGDDEAQGAVSTAAGLRSAGSEAVVEGGCVTCGDAADASPEDSPEQPLLVADICTGSGCVACAIASERPDARVLAVDISSDAVALARENVEQLGLCKRVAVLQGDLGAPVPERFMGKLDVVVSNPPYVPSSVLADIPREVSAYEPALALDGGADGLDLVRRLLPWCARALKPGGHIAFELHEGHLDEAAKLASAAGFTGVRIVEDLAGRPRVLVACKA